MPKLRLDQLLTTITICLLLIVPVSAAQFDPPPPQLPPLVRLAPVPISEESTLAKEAFVATLSAKSVIVIDVPSAAVLLSNNANEPVSPASTTKMLTALVARDAYDLNEIVTIGDAALTIGHQVGFATAEQLSVKDLLASLLISSGNDAALALANHYPQGYDEFIKAMNLKAQQLHLSHSSFRNPAGLDDPNHLSTAQDLAILARALMNDPILKEIVHIKKITVTDVTGTHEHLLVNTNELLHTEPGVVGIKTGTTELAKENVITEVDRNGYQVLFVVLSSEDRYGDTKRLLTWVEQHYRWVQPDETRLQVEKEE